MRNDHEQQCIALVAFNHLTQEEDEHEFELAGVSKYTQMQGVWNGQEERAYMIDAEDLDSLRDALARCGQEFVLFRDGQFEGYLLSKSDNYTRDWSPEGVKRQYAGKWRGVEATQAARLTSYTKYNGRYFACRK